MERRIVPSALIPKPVMPVVKAPVVVAPQPKPFSDLMGRQHNLIEDTFVGLGTLRTDTETKDIRIARDGNLFEPSKEKAEKKTYQWVGQLNNAGDFWFQSGETGNVFSSGQFKRPLIAGTANNPFVSLGETRAKQASVIPAIRAALTSQGIDGRGVNMAFIEMAPKGENGLVMKNHIEKARAVAVDSDYGLAPGAYADYHLFAEQRGVSSDHIDDPEMMFEFFGKGAVGFVGSVNQKLETLYNEGQPLHRVISMSIGDSVSENLKGILDVLNDKTPEGTFRYPISRTAILGDTSHAEPYEQEQTVLEKLNTALTTSPVVLKELQRYRDITKKLAAVGTVVVASAGNQRELLEPRVRVPAGAGFNLLAQSDHVISVAASHNNLTPMDTTDDQVAPFSSRGDGQRWNPTVTAQGMEMWLGKSFGTSPDERFSGTSAAAPFVSGTVALMLQTNPELGFQDVKNILQQTATDTQASVAEEGAGMLNPITAVQAAMNYPTQPQQFQSQQQQAVMSFNPYSSVPSGFNQPAYSPQSLPNAYNPWAGVTAKASPVIA